MAKDDIKIRKKWPSDMDPSIRVHKVKTDYSRKGNKQAIEDALSEAEDENKDLDNWY